MATVVQVSFKVQFSVLSIQILAGALQLMWQMLHWIAFLLWALTLNGSFYVLHIKMQKNDLLLIFTNHEHALIT